MEGGQDRVGGEQPAHDVRDRHPHLGRLASGLARDAHYAAPRLHQKVVAGALLVRPGTEPGNGAIDEAGVRCAQRLVAQAELLQGPAPPVLDHDIGPRRKLLDPLQALRSLEIDPDRTLVAVDG